MLFQRPYQSTETLSYLASKKAKISAYLTYFALLAGSTTLSSYIGACILNNKNPHEYNVETIAENAAIGSSILSIVAAFALVALNIQANRGRQLHPLTLGLSTFVTFSLVNIFGAALGSVIKNHDSAEANIKAAATGWGAELLTGGMTVAATSMYAGAYNT